MKTRTKLISGAVVAVGLAVAAAVFLKSKTGKKIRQEAGELMGDFYKDLAPRLKKIKNVGETEYKELVKEAAAKFGKAKKLSQEKISELIQEAQESWKHFTK